MKFKPGDRLKLVNAYDLPVSNPTIIAGQQYIVDRTWSGQDFISLVGIRCPFLPNNSVWFCADRFVHTDAANSYED